MTYNWSGPNGFTSTSRTPTTTEAGTYTVTITDSATGCSDSAQTTVSLESEASIDNINSSCITDNIVVDYTFSGSQTQAWIGLYEKGDANSEFIIWQWVPTIPGSGTVTFVNHGLSSGNYEARLFSGDAFQLCQTSAFTLNPLPNASATNDGPLTCNQTNVILTATPAGMTYAWSGGGTSQTKTVTTPGTYSVTITDTNGCSSMTETTVTENTTPTPIFLSLIHI